MILHTHQLKVYVPSEKPKSYMRVSKGCTDPMESFSTISDYTAFAHAICIRFKYHPANEERAIFVNGVKEYSNKYGTKTIISGVYIIEILNFFKFYKAFDKELQQFIILGPPMSFNLATLLMIIPFLRLISSYKE